MRHYSKVELQLVIDSKDLELHDSQDIQDHLLTCDACMELYLDLIDKIDQEETLENEGFTDRVMNLIYKENMESSQRKDKQKQINTLIYYVSAASITLFLMGTGAFQDIYQSFTSVEKHVYENPQKQSLFTNGWTSKLTDVASKFIGGIIIDN